MSVYAVVLDNENHDAVERIRTKYSNYHELSRTLFLVHTDAIADQVARTIGIKGDNRIEGAEGVVFKLNHSYAGYTSRALWDWLTQAEEQE